MSFALPPAIQSPAPAAAEARRFDFWLGDWEVRTPEGELDGRCVVTLVSSGAALQERFYNPDGSGGTSLTAYQPASGQWRQTWVDSRGRFLDLVGGFEGERLVLKGETAIPEGRRLERVAWWVQQDGSVREVWDQSLDDGKTWKPHYDGIFRKRNNHSPPRH